MSEDLTGVRVYSGDKMMGTVRSVHWASNQQVYLLVETPSGRFERHDAAHLSTKPT